MNWGKVHQDLVDAFVLRKINGPKIAGSMAGENLNGAHMKILAFALLSISSFLVNSSFAQVVDTQKYLNPSLEDGQCHSIADSKIYLNSYQAEKSSWKEIVSQFSDSRFQQIHNTSERSWYFCKLNCSFNGAQESVWVGLQDKNENFKNMNGFVCPGLRIDDVSVSPSLTIKIPVANPFWAASSGLVHLNQYLQNKNYKLSNQSYQLLLVQLRENAKAIAMSYKKSNYFSMEAAGDKLIQWFGEGSDPLASPDLLERIHFLDSLNWDKKIELKDILSTENLVDRFLMDQGRFFQFVDRSDSSKLAP